MILKKICVEPSLKGKKSYYLSEIVRPETVYRALHSLKKYHPAYKDIKVGWRQSSASKWLAGRIHSLPPSSLGRGQETIEMCETQLGLYMIMDPDVFSSHYYQRPVITRSNDKFACH